MGIGIRCARGSGIYVYPVLSYYHCTGVYGQETGRYQGGETAAELFRPTIVTLSWTRVTTASPTLRSRSCLAYAEQLLQKRSIPPCFLSTSHFRIGEPFEEI